MLASLFFLVCAFIESIYVLHLQQSNETLLLLQSSVRKWKMAMENGQMVKRKTNNEVDRLQYQRDHSSFVKQTANIKKIDIGAFIVSGVLFFIFNIIYWLTFLVLRVD